MSVVEYDNGTELIVTIKDDTSIVDLTTATLIKGRFVNDKHVFEKEFTILDATEGTCTTTLTNNDLICNGSYKFQLKLTFTDGKEFSSNTHRLIVSSKI